MGAAGVARFIPGIAFALLAALCLPSCGDDARVASPDPNADPPPVTIADLPLSFEFQSDDSLALEASAIATDLLLSIWPEAGHAHATFSMTTLGNWERTEEDCWACSQDWRPIEPKRILCTACPQEGGYAWDLQNQEFDAEGALLLSRQRSRGTTSADGLNGEFSYFSSHAPYSLLLSWSWLAAADRRSVSWAFYLGPVDPLFLDATMEWDLDAEGSRHWVWIWPADERIEFLLNEDSTAGWLRDERWFAGQGAWRLVHAIDWVGGHGTRVTFDAQGNPIRDCAW